MPCGTATGAPERSLVMKSSSGTAVTGTPGSPTPATLAITLSLAAMKTSWPALRTAVASGASPNTVAALPAAMKRNLTGPPGKQNRGYGEATPPIPPAGCDRSRAGSVQVRPLLPRLAQRLAPPDDLVEQRLGRGLAAFRADDRAVLEEVAPRVVEADRVADGVG